MTLYAITVFPPKGRVVFFEGCTSSYHEITFSQKLIEFT